MNEDDVMKLDLVYYFFSISFLFLFFLIQRLKQSWEEILSLRSYITLAN